jgi:hypothetical protein
MQIPNFDSTVITATGKDVTIWVNRDRPNYLGMSCQGTQQLATTSIPNLDGFVCTATSKDLPIGVDGNTSDNV